jgi:hypothetical protein
VLTVVLGAFAAGLICRRSSRSRGTRIRVRLARDSSGVACGGVILAVLLVDGSGDTVSYLKCSARV